MTTISDERLAEIVGAGTPCVPIEPWEVALVVQELRSLRAQGGVRVKPLEWEEFWNRSEAKSTVGDYIIMPRRDGAFDWRLDGVVSCWSSSSEGAKAAAQADYERRILSSLEASPAPVSERGGGSHTIAASSPVPADHPLMAAWTAYASTEGYANTFRWAGQEEHREGSLWAAFEQGYRAALAAKGGQ